MINNANFFEPYHSTELESTSGTTDHRLAYNLSQVEDKSKQSIAHITNGLQASTYYQKAT
jgi:hypothetical protein